MNHTNPFPPAKPGLMHRSGWRLIRWRLLRRVRRWEVHPVGQRKRQVLMLFAGLLLLGGWSVGSNLSGRPPELIRPQHARQRTNPTAHRQPLLNRNPDVSNRSGSLNVSRTVHSR